MLQLLTVGLFTLILTACTTQPSFEKKMAVADQVYTNGRIYTVNESAPWAKAMAVKGGVILEIGNQEDTNQYVQASTEVIDLKGQFVMPGIQDAHIHTQMVAEFNASLNINPEHDWQTLSNRIKEYANANPEKLWILGGNLPWLTETIGDNPEVSAHKSSLDHLSDTHAIALWDVGGHAMLINSKALELAGIDANTPNPIGGTIERDANSEATGVLRELATSIITENATALTVDQYATGLKASFEHLASLGVTAINEVWTFPSTLKALKQLDDQRALDLRVTASIAHPVEYVGQRAKKDAHNLINNIDQFQGEKFKTRYVKFVLDGSAGGQTLALVDPYLGTDFTGHMRNSEDIVKSEVARLHKLGIGSVLHAVGDRAIRIALDAVEGAIEQHGRNGVRHVIAHTVFVNPEDLVRFKALGVIAEFSPYFWWPTEGAEILRDELGEDRLGWGFPVKKLLEDGNHLAAGSDWPVVIDPNPFPPIEAMVTREKPGGSDESFGKKHAIELADVIRIFTMGSAYELYQENTTGSLEVGKYADFIVLDQNIMDVPIREVHKTKVLSTYIAGKNIYQKNTIKEMQQ